MTQLTINAPEIGSNVWSNGGFRNHGPSDGPKIDIPACTLGKIIRSEKPYFSMDSLLYVIQWESGQQSKHYCGDLFCLGPFHSVESFKQMIRTLQNAELTKGPSGGFIKFSADVIHDGVVKKIKFFKEDKSIYDSIVAPILSESGLQIKITVMPRKSKHV